MAVPMTNTPHTTRECLERLEMLREAYGITEGPEVDAVWAQYDFLTDSPEHYN